MKPVEEFLNEYFRIRGEFSRMSSDKQAECIDRFIAGGYGTSHWELEEGDTEVIASVRASEDAAEAITNCSRLGPGHAISWRSRYTIVRAGEAWEIVSIEIECSICEGIGMFNGGDCEVCKGKGWRTD